MQTRNLRIAALLSISALTLSACGNGLGIFNLGSSPAPGNLGVIPADSWVNGATLTQEETVKLDGKIELARRMGDYFVVATDADNKTAKAKAFTLEDGKLKQVWDKEVPKDLLSQNQVFKHYLVPAYLNGEEMLDLRTGEILKTGWKNPFSAGETLPMLYPLMAPRVTDNVVYCEINAFTRETFDDYDLRSRFAQPEPFHCAAFQIGKPEAVWTFERAKAVASLAADEVLILDLQTGQTEVKKTPFGSAAPEMERAVFFKDNLPTQFIPTQIGDRWVAVDENFNFTEITDESGSSQLKLSDACAITESGLRTHKLYYNTADVQAILQQPGKVPDDGSTPVMCYSSEKNVGGFYVPGKGLVEVSKFPFRGGYLLPSDSRQIASYTVDYDLWNSGCLYDVTTGEQLIEGRCESQYLMDPERVVQFESRKDTFILRLYSPGN